MSNLERHHIGYVQIGQYYRQLAAELGLDREALYEDDFDHLFDIDTLVSWSIPTPGQLQAQFLAGMTMDVRYEPTSLTVTEVWMSLQGRLAYEWSGAMSAQAFLDGYWPVDLSYGSPSADLLFIENGTAYAGNGNDILQMGGNAVAYGQGGRDVFALEYVGHGNNLRIADYEMGERIYFAMYDSVDELIAAFQGVSDVSANRFTLHFAQRFGPHWSLTVEGAGLEPFAAQPNLLGEIVLVGLEGAERVYAPVMEAFGIL